jgi:AraC-like DNA-binding protein
LWWEVEPAIVQISNENPAPPPNLKRELRNELARRIAQLMGSAETLQTAIPGLSLYRRTSPTAPLSVTYQPSVAIVVQGRKRVELRGTTLIYDASRFLLTSVDLPVLSQVIEASDACPYLCLRLKLEIPIVAELLSQGEIPAIEVPSEGPAMTTSETTVDLLRACNRLMDLLNSPGDIPFLSDPVQREIIYRILQSSEGQRLRAIASLGDQSHRTAKAIAWIRENYSKPLSIEHLARMAGMGVSTLHAHFRELTSMSPLQYQKQLRLQAARLLMLTDGLDAATAAFEVGYGSATQFNREYSRFFGQPPKRDVRTLRSPGGLPAELVTGQNARAAVSTN